MFGQWIKLQMSLNTTMNTTVQESFDEQVRFLKAIIFQHMDNFKSSTVGRARLQGIGGAEEAEEGDC